MLGARPILASIRKDIALQRYRAALSLVPSSSTIWNLRSLALYFGNILYYRVIIQAWKVSTFGSSLDEPVLRLLGDVLLKENLP